MKHPYRMPLAKYIVVMQAISDWRVTELIDQHLSGVHAAAKRGLPIPQEVGAEYPRLRELLGVPASRIIPDAYAGIARRFLQSGSEKDYQQAVAARFFPIFRQTHEVYTRYSIADWFDDLERIHEELYRQTRWLCGLDEENPGSQAEEAATQGVYRRLLEEISDMPYSRGRSHPQNAEKAALKVLECLPEKARRLLAFPSGKQALYSPACGPVHGEDYGRLLLGNPSHTDASLLRGLLEHGLSVPAEILLHHPDLLQEFGL